MARKVAQLQFTNQQLGQLEDLRCQAGLTRTERVGRAVDFYVLHFKEHGYKSTMIPLPTLGTSDAGRNSRLVRLYLPRTPISRNHAG